MTGTSIEETTIAGFPATVGNPAEPIDGAPPLVFVHGAFADHTGFDGWVERAAGAGFRAVAASRRGRLGLGPEHAAGLSFDDYMTDTLAVLDEVGGQPVVVGHSLGALIAQRLAELGRTSGIALVNPAPPGMLTAQPVALPKFAPLLPRIMSGRTFIVPAGACDLLALDKVPEAERPPLHAHLTHESGKVYRSLMMGTIRIDAKKVTVPVTVVGGREDKIVSTGLVEKTARHYGVVARILDGHGHWLLAEPGWESLSDDLLAWVRENVLQPTR